MSRVSFENYQFVHPKHTPENSKPHRPSRSMLVGPKPTSITECDEAKTCMLRVEESEVAVAMLRRCGRSRGHYYRQKRQLSSHSKTSPLHHTTWSVVELCVQYVTSVRPCRACVVDGLVVELCVPHQRLVVVGRVCVWVVRSFEWTSNSQSLPPQE